MPLHSVPRLGSACPHSGIAPGAATAASLPRCPLRNACVRPLGKGQQIKIKSHSHSHSHSHGKIKRSQPRFTRQLLQGERCTHASHHSTGRALARLPLLIWMHRPLERPSGGSAQWATRHGCRVSRPRPWMADGGGPPEQCLRYGMPSLGEAPNGGAKPFGSFLAFEKGTRCKSETVISHHRRNGYAPELTSPRRWGTLFCFRIYVARNFHNASKTIRPRQTCRTVINGNAASDRATFAHRASPGAENWPTEGKAPLYF